MEESLRRFPFSVINKEIAPKEFIHMKNQIGSILQDVHCLQDITEECIAQLKSVNAGPIKIERFATSPQEVEDWKSKNGDKFKDVGLNGDQNRLVIRPHYAWVMEALRAFSRSKELAKFKLALNNETLQYFYFLTRAILVSSFDNAVDAPPEKLDNVLAEHYSSNPPVVAIELAWSECPVNLRESEENVLLGVPSVEKVVILLKFLPHSHQSISPDDTWDLSEDEIQTVNHARLCKHALKWYHTRGIHLVEEFDLEVHYWLGRQHFPTKFGFHFRYYTDLDLVENRDFTIGASAFRGNGQLVIAKIPFPLMKLVIELQRKWERVEFQRIAAFVHKRRNWRFYDSSDDEYGMDED